MSEPAKSSDCALHELLREVLDHPDPHARLIEPDIATRLEALLEEPLPDHPDAHGTYVEHLAAWIGDPDLVRRLAGAGARFGHNEDTCGRWPIEYLVHARGPRERLVACQRLVEHAIAVDEASARLDGHPVDERGNSALHAVLWRALCRPDPRGALRRPDIARELERALSGPLPRFPNADGWYVEHVAATIGDPRLLARLVAMGGDFHEKRNAQGRRPIDCLPQARHADDEAALAACRRIIEAAPPPERPRSERVPGRSCVPRIPRSRP